MKKNFFLTLMLALLCTATAWAEFNPEQGKAYALKLVGTELELYMDVETLGRKPNEVDNNISLSATPTQVFFEVAQYGWSIKNSRGNYITVGSEAWNPAIQDSYNDCDWIIDEPEVGVITIIQPWTKKYIGTDNPNDGGLLWCSRPAEDYVRFQLIEFSQFEQAYTLSVVDMPDGASIKYNGNEVTNGAELGADFDPTKLVVTCPAGYTWEVNKDTDNRTVTITFTAAAPVATPTEAITGLLNRIGGNGAANKFEIVIDASLAQDGKDVFIITSQNGKPCIKGNNQLSVATGINWYLNHYAHINLTWNKLSTDLVNVSLPLPDETVTKECSADLRYYLNYCTFSYTSALWTEERWMQEIDWMALHGINMPLMLVGLDCVWYDLYTKAEYGYNYKPEEISKHIAGPAFQAWWAMINCEGHGGPNPAWWYERSRALATNMLARMRSYGMEPVLPGFCGEVPSSLKGKLNDDPEINTGGKWQGFDAPGLMGHKSTNWAQLAANYYDALEGVMGTSKYYSMDPFHEEATGLTGSSANDMKGYFQSCYAQMKTNVGEGVVWVAQDWGSNPRDAMLTGLNNGELIVLDLFAEADPHYSSGYKGHDYIYCMLHNFGGRVGLHGRFNKTMDGYYAALAARGDQMVGIGATPEGVENNPMLYDMLFELPWRETAPDKTEWVNSYTVSRYGKSNETVQKAYSKLMQSVYNCTTGQQGTSEPIICAIPSLTATKVSSWASAAVDYEHEIVIAAADEMLSQVDEFDVLNDNFNYDLLDVVRQALTNYALDMLAQLNIDYSANKFDATFSARKNHYLALIEDIDELLGTHQKFRLGNWAEMARAIVTEDAASRNGAGKTDADWLEFENLRRQITTWAPFWSPLRDYSNREWNGLVKDYYLERWKIYFDALEAGTESSLSNDYWYNYGNTYVHDDTKTYTAAPVGDTRTIARSAFDNYFFVDTDDKSNKVYFSRHIEQSKAADEYVKYAYRGKDFTFKIPEGTTATLSIDANSDGVFGDGETVNNNTFRIPADAATTTVKAFIVLSDNTEISFYVFLADLIETDRTVTVQAGDNGSVAIEGTAESSITNSEYVTMTATAASGYEFSHWVQVADGTETEVSRENPFIYLGKDAATFKAYFIENIWGVPSEDWSDRGDITNKQYLTSITCVQEENTTEIYSASEATAGLFVPVATMINAAKGSQFTIDWQGDGNMKNCYLSAYIDLNQDGDFDDAGELIMVKGTLGAANNSVEKGPMQVLLPYDMPTGITHIRLRFDGAWKTNYNKETKAFPASITINRRCYEIALNVTEHSAGNSHIVITSNNTEWGTVRNITGVTGEDINVPSGTEICMEAFPKDGYMFVHWLDKYGRVASTNSSFYYTPCESGEFTAIFKEIPPETIEIDGWQIEYRTEPGKDVVTTKLANGVKPEAGKKYYIYAPTRPTNDGEYVNRYLYNNNGTLTLSTTESTAASYLWLCSIEDGKYVFQNVADPAKYLKHKGLADAPYGFELGTGTTYYEGLTMQSVPGDGETRNLFFVINDNGSGFNHSERAHNQSTEDYTTDFVFTEVTVPDVVILTSVRKSGKHDLVIPETVNILGEDLKIVGFDNNLFKDNKDLWSISLPATIEQLSNKEMFKHTLTGNGQTQVFDVDIKNNESWSIRMEVERTGELKGWGACLIASGENPAKPDGSNYAEGFQFYLQCTEKGGDRDKLIIKTKNQVNDDWYFDDVYQEEKFYIYVDYNGSQQISINVLKADGTNATNSNGKQEPLVFTGCSIQNITKLCTNVQAVITNKIEIIKGAEPDPFEGCTNLLNITVAADCKGGYKVDGREFKNASGDVLHTLASEDKRDKLLALSELIDLTEALIAEVATNVDPTGKATAIGLQANDLNAAFYVSTNADQNTGGGNSDGGGIAALVDNNEGTYFHSRWSGTDVNATHHIQVDLGERNRLSEFKFSYVSANGPDPTKIVVKGSNNGEQFDQIGDIIIKNAINSGDTYGSDIIEAEQSYRYLRFEVAKSERWGSNATPQGEYCFSMKEFDIYDLTSSAEVAPKYANLARVTAGDVEGVYDSMTDALYVYNNGGTAEQLTAAYDALKPLYDALNTKKDKIFYGVYNIYFSGDPVFVAYAEANELNGLTGGNIAGFRLFDGAVAHEGAADGNTVAQKEFHERVIANRAVADALFTIVPNADATGYILSAQGQYMQTTAVHAKWSIQAFDADEAKAGVYLFEVAESADIYKLRSNKEDGLQYVNDWGPVFGNNSASDTYARFSLKQITEYTLTVPEGGATTLCLPFNVVLPEGVIAYDLAKANITKGNYYSTYELVTVATAGETLAKNTPVIIKAAANDYTLAITMDGEGAKASVKNSVLRSGIVKTTLADGNNYTFDGENFNRVATGTVIPANQCYMALDENLGDIIYGEALAFILTTDEENPVLYKIQINRNFDAPNASVLEYNANTGGVNVRADAADNSWQAWYFMAGNDGAVLIKPYNGDGKVLGADDNNDGHSKVWAVENGTKTVCEWTIENNGDWYNILGDGRCFSNHSGVTYKTMGFYNDKNDNGSQFKFVEAVFTDDNARYYQLNDYLPVMNQGIFVGESVGLYSEDGVATLNTKRTEAQALVDAGSKASASDACYTMYKALRTAKKDAYNAPAADKAYYIVSTASGNGREYCAGEYVRTYRTPTGRSCWAGTNTYDQTHLLFDAETDIEQMSLAAFQFEETGKQGEYRMKNLHTGLYVKAFAGTHMGTKDEAQVVKIAGVADGQVTLKIGNNAPMHAQNDFGVIVQWNCDGGNADSPSSWVINEVADMSEIYTLAVPDAGVTTLNLAFNVQLPEGVTAYDFTEGYIAQAESGDRNEFTLKQVATAGEVLAKNTPVIVKANAGEYDLKVTFSDENVKNGTAGSVLHGNYWQTTVGTADLNYLPGVDGERLAFNKVTADDTVVAANTVWAVLSSAVNAETIYEFVPEPEAPTVEIVAGKVYRIKNYTENTPAEYQYHYLVNSNVSIAFPTTVESGDKSAMWVCTSADEVNHKYTFVSALGTAAFGWQGATEEAVEYTIYDGTIQGTITLVSNNVSLALTTEAWNNRGKAAFNQASNSTKVQAENWSTDWYLETVEDANVVYDRTVVAGHHWGTLYLPYAVEVPENLTAYYATTVDKEKKVIDLYNVGEVIPAYTAVVFNRADDSATETFSFCQTAESATTVNGNLLAGRIMTSAVGGEDDNNNYYLLMNASKGEAFYWVYKEFGANGHITHPGTHNGGHILCEANKAFLAIEAGSVNPAALSFRYGGNTTEVDEIESENVEVKAIYDLQGRKLTEITEPGIYIVNGKKVLVK